MTLKSINPNREFFEITELLYNYVVMRDCGICQICGRRGEHLHHIIYRSQGGKHKANNLIFLCGKCHTGDKGVHGTNVNIVDVLLNKVLKNEVRLRERLT